MTPPKAPKKPKKDARKYPQADVKILYGLAAARCSWGKCRKDVVLKKTKKDKEKQIGKIAHIVAHSATGPRANAQYPKEKLDTYENWILLCPTCHDTVDAQHSTFTIDDLRQAKLTHERWVSGQLGDGMAAVSFAELEVVTKGILSSNDNTVENYTIIQPIPKMQKNGLTGEVSHLITIGLSRSREVENFIVHLSQIDSSFSGRLITGFKSKYNELRASGLEGDGLFQAMFEFSGGNASNFIEKAAGLAVLCHLFVACEIFET